MVTTTRRKIASSIYQIWFRFHVQVGAEIDNITQNRQLHRNSSPFIPSLPDKNPSQHCWGTDVNPYLKIVYHWHFMNIEAGALFYTVTGIWNRKTMPTYSLFWSHKRAIYKFTITYIASTSIAASQWNSSSFPHFFYIPAAVPATSVYIPRNSRHPHHRAMQLSNAKPFPLRTCVSMPYLRPVLPCQIWSF